MYFSHDSHSSSAPVYIVYIVVEEALGIDEFPRNNHLNVYPKDR